MTLSNFSFFTDTRYFTGMMDTPLSLDSKTSLPTERQTWMKLEEVSKSLTARTKHGGHCLATKSFTVSHFQGIVLECLGDEQVKLREVQGDSAGGIMVLRIGT